MRRRPPIVAVLGVDGSGKSTQTRLLAEALRRDGIGAAAYTNPGGRPALNKFAQWLGKPDGRALIGARAVVALETAIRFVAIARALLLAGLTGRVAIMDRYTYCQYAIMRARGDHGERIARRILGVFPTPDVTVVLEAPAGVATRRVELRGHDHEDPVYLTRLDAAYRSLPEFGAFAEVDAAGTIEDVQRSLHGVVVAALAPRTTGGITNPRGTSDNLPDDTSGVSGPRDTLDE